MCLFMPLGRILLQGSVSMNLFGPIRHQVDLRKVAVGIVLLGIVYLGVDMTTPGVHFVPVLRRRPSSSICFLIYISPLHELCSQGIGFGIRLLAGSPE